MGLKFHRVAVCEDCSTIVSKKGDLEKLEDIERAWVRIVMSLPLANFRCPKKCRASGSDYNANVGVKLILEGTDKLMAFEDAVKLKSTEETTEPSNTQGV